MIAAVLIIDYLQSKRIAGITYYDLLTGMGRSLTKGIGLGIGVMVTFAASGFLTSFQERATFYMIMAEVNTYRAYSDAVKCSPQVTDTITKLNARIAHEHESNIHWWSDWFSTDLWNTVDLIPLNCKKETPVGVDWGNVLRQGDIR